MAVVSPVSLSRYFRTVTHLLLPLFYFLSFTFPAVVFRSHRSGNVPWVGFDLLRAGLLKAEVIGPLKAFLLFQEGLPFSFRILHVIVDDLIIRWNPWRYVLYEFAAAYMQNLKKKNKIEILGRHDILFIVIIVDITFSQDVVSQELLLFIQFWVIPVIS